MIYWLLITPCIFVGQISSVIYRGSLFGYPSFSEATASLDSLLQVYPKYFTKQYIGASFEKRPIYAYVISSQTSANSNGALLLTSLIHAREPLGLSVLLYFAEKILQAIELKSFDLRGRQVYMVPFVNVDGYVEMERSKDKGIRKNRRNGCTKSKDMGVDLNRNFDFNWKYVADPCNEEYAGSAPFSEPETQAIKHLVETVKFDAALNFHTFGEVLTHSWNYDGSAPLISADEEIFKHFEQVLNFTKFGTAPRVFGYSASGESDDWMYGVKGIISMSPEIGPESGGFITPANLMDEMVDLNYRRILKVLDIVGSRVEIHADASGDLLVKNIGFSSTHRRAFVIFKDIHCREQGLARLSGGWVVKETELFLPRRSKNKISSSCLKTPQTCLLSDDSGCSCLGDSSGCPALIEWVAFKLLKNFDPSRAEEMSRVYSGSSPSSDDISRSLDIIIVVVTLGGLFLLIRGLKRTSSQYSALSPSVVIGNSHSL